MWLVAYHQIIRVQIIRVYEMCATYEMQFQCTYKNQRVWIYVCVNLCVNLCVCVCNYKLFLLPRTHLGYVHPCPPSWWATPRHSFWQFQSNLGRSWWLSYGEQPTKSDKGCGHQETRGREHPTKYLVCENISIDYINHFLVSSREVCTHFLHQPLLSSHTRVTISILLKKQKKGIEIWTTIY